MRQTITAQSSTEALGRNVTFNSVLAADGAVYDNNDQLGWIVVNNTTAAPKELRLSTDRTYSPQSATINYKAYTIPANAKAFMIPPVQNSFWSQVDTTNIYLDTDADGLDVAIVKPA